MVHKSGQWYILIQNVEDGAKSGGNQAANWEHTALADKPSRKKDMATNSLANERAKGPVLKV